MDKDKLFKASEGDCKLTIGKVVELIDDDGGTLFDLSEALLNQSSDQVRVIFGSNRAIRIERMRPNGAWEIVKWPTSWAGILDDVRAAICK